MEFVIVVYPTARPVQVDGHDSGITNDLLRVDAGTHVFRLGEPLDFEPEFLEVRVENTTSLDPMEITFSPKGVTG